MHREGTELYPTILKLDGRWKSVVNPKQRLYPRERTLLPTEQQAGWAPQPVWTYCRKEKSTAPTRGELSYLAPLGSENISVPSFKQCFFGGGGLTPIQTESNTAPHSPKTEIINILFYILNFASIITFKM